MSPRALSASLALIFALAGVGAPRFAHLMTAHVPSGASAESGSVAKCTSSCCAFHHADAAAETSESESSTTSESESRHCPVCELLASLLTSVPALPIVSPTWEPVIERAVASAPSLIAQDEFDPHSPRGPPLIG